MWQLVLQCKDTKKYLTRWNNNDFIALWDIYKRTPRGCLLLGVLIYRSGVHHCI